MKCLKQVRFIEKIEGLFMSLYQTYQRKTTVRRALPAAEQLISEAEPEVAGLSAAVG